MRTKRIVIMGSVHGAGGGMLSLNPVVVGESFCCYCNDL